MALGLRAMRVMEVVENGYLFSFSAEKSRKVPRPCGVVLHGCGCARKKTDVRMPGMSGLELQSHLNAAGFRIPIIFISAHDDGEAKSRALEAGSVGFLKKPFSEDALLSALRACLRVEGDITNDPGRDESF